MAIKSSPKKSRSTEDEIVDGAPVIRIAPGQRGVSIWSPSLFSDSGTAEIRHFLSRAFSVAEVAAVDLHRAEAFGRIRYENSADAPAIWRKLSQVLRQPTPAPAVGKSPSSEEGFIQPRGVNALYLDGPAELPIRIHRIGTYLSTWRLRYESRARVRLTHPVLLNRRDVAYRLEEELASILGVQRFRTSVLTSSVVVHFDPRQLNVSRLLRQLETAWPRLLDGLDGPPSTKRLVAATGLLGLAYTGQHLVPALRRWGVLGVIIYAFPNVINAARQLARGEVGLPALYTAGLAFLLVSGLPLNATIMALLMQLWPFLAYRTMTKSQRRLFATHRRRVTWARLIQDEGVEMETDIDRLGVGEMVNVRAGELVPVDGVITEGLAAIDEEVVTGRAGAQDKTVGDPVYAGTFVRDGLIAVRVEKIGADTAVAAIATHLPQGKLKLPSVAEAEIIAARMAKPALAVAAINLLTTGMPRPSQAVIRPDYATGPRLSAQLGALHDIGEALHAGILFRDPAAVDRLPAANIYVFDDSPALERRHIEVGDVFPVSGVSASDLLAHAAAAFPPLQNERADALRARCADAGAIIPPIHERERRAGAIRYRDEENHLLAIAALPYLVSRGIQIPASISSRLASSASAWLPQTHGSRRQPQPHTEPVLRPLWVIRNEKVMGVVTFDRRGPFEGAEVIAKLRAANPKARFLYISSHAQARAESIGEKIGISAIHGDLDKRGKEQILKELGRRTMWIGDGTTRDALPCIAASGVSVSLAGGNTVADDAANIVLLQPSLRDLVALRRIGRDHRARNKASNRAIYSANLLAAAGGFLANFGSLESGLTSNAGTAYVYSKHWNQLRTLIKKFDAREARLTAPIAEESTSPAELKPAKSGAFKEPIEAQPIPLPAKKEKPADGV